MARDLTPQPALNGMVIISSGVLAFVEEVVDSITNSL